MADAVSSAGASRIGFVRAASGATVLDGVVVVSPLALTRCFYLDTGSPGSATGMATGMATVILQSTTGALGPGDEVVLELSAGAGAQAHVTTQGATVVHGGDTCRPTALRTTVTAGAGALVELLPQSLVLFPGARLVSELTIDLADGAVVVAQEVVTGHDPRATDRPADWFAGLATSVVVRRSGRVLAAERVDLDGGADLAAPGLLGPARATGALWVVGAVPSDALLASWRGLPGLRVASLPNDAGLVARRLGTDGPEVAADLHMAWVAARTLLAGAPPSPRRTGAAVG